MTVIGTPFWIRNIYGKPAMFVTLTMAATGSMIPNAFSLSCWRTRPPRWLVGGGNLILNIMVLLLCKAEDAAGLFRHLVAWAVAPTNQAPFAELSANSNADIDLSRFHHHALTTA